MKNKIFCTFCGTQMEEIEREPRYSEKTGELIGYWVQYKCPSRRWGKIFWGDFCSGGNTAYETKYEEIKNKTK